MQTDNALILMNLCGGSSMSFMDEFNFWLNDDYFDQATKDELLKIKDNESEIEDRFYRELEFGTGGLRGVIGAGTNRMNKYTVGKATQGLANYILEQGTQGQGVAISYDSRRMSKEFSEQTALILNANGIKTLRKGGTTFSVFSLFCFSEILQCLMNFCINSIEGNFISAYDPPSKSLVGCCLICDLLKEY